METEKSRLRQSLKMALQQLSSAEKSAAEQELARQLQSHADLCAAKTVMIYEPFSDEIAFRPAIVLWEEEGKRLLIPQIISDEEMVAVDKKTGERVALESIDVILVPGRAFDSRGRRLGRGRAYYDRFLSQKGLKARLIGLAYACQQVPAVPVAEHDVILDECLFG